MRWAYFTVFTICMVTVSYFALQSLTDLSVALKKSTDNSMDNRQKDLELRLADLKSEILSLKGDIGVLRSGQTRAVELATQNSESLQNMRAMLEESPKRMGQMNQQGDPIREVIGVSVELTRNVMRAFSEQANAKERADGKYWKDGEVGLLDRIEYPREEFDMQVRYFASPEQDKYTLVIMPSHRKLKEEIRDKYPLFALALTSSGALFICKACPVDAPEKLDVPGWQEENNIPKQGEWFRFDEKNEKPGVGEQQQQRGPEQMPPNRPAPAKRK